jgi:hypothetical protein
MKLRNKLRFKAVVLPIFWTIAMMSVLAIENGQEKWSSWQAVPSDSKIEFRLLRREYNEDAKKWFWSYELSHHYDKTVNVWWKDADNAEQLKNRDYTSLECLMCPRAK